MDSRRVEANSSVPSYRDGNGPLRRGLRLGAWLGIAILACLLAVIARAGQVAHARAATAQAARDSRSGAHAQSGNARLIHAQPTQFSPDPVFEGTLDPIQESDLAFAVAGRLIEVDKQVGDCVTRGTVLARLDPRSASTRLSVAAAEAVVAAARDEAATDVDERTQSLKVSGAVAEAEAARSKHASELAKAERQAANSRVALARMEVTEHVLLAPFSGCLTTAPKGPGAFAALGAVQFHLLDPSALRLSGSLDARDASLFPIGAELRVQAQGVQVPARVSALVAAVDATSRRVRLVAIVPNQGARTLLPGSFARAQLAATPRFAAFRVPSSATVAGSEHDVWAVSAGRLVRRPLDVAWEENEFLIARGGISDTDAIVATPNFDMKEGDPWPGAAP